MEADRIRQKIRGGKIAREIASKRRERAIDEVMEEFDLSPEDAEFYLDNKELVDTSHGSSLLERIDEAHMYLNGSGEE